MFAVLRDVSSEKQVEETLRAFLLTTRRAYELPLNRHSMHIDVCV